jgi:hypothetical protein
VFFEIDVRRDEAPIQDKKREMGAGGRRRHGHTTVL